jgi:hypothetical protein
MLITGNLAKMIPRIYFIYLLKKIKPNSVPIKHLVFDTQMPDRKFTLFNKQSAVFPVVGKSHIQLSNCSSRIL